ncbi:MAG: DUF4185 domain-containing protein [Armatimonadetes bacterium]|nr:DUF4185 domain-containing protein [Armatimonadota bacterium]
MTAAITAALLLAVVVGVGAAENRAVPAPEIDRMFQRTRGWTGADGAFNFDLGNKRTLWLFMDTFAGSVKDGRRISSTLIHNSVGIETHKRVNFFFAESPEGGSSALFKPPEGAGYLWPFAGVRGEKELSFFAMRVKPSGAGGPFGFHIFGQYLARVTDLHPSPKEWKVSYKRFPFCSFADDGSLFYGCATLRSNGFIYIYGQDNRRANLSSPGPSAMVVARVQEGDMSNFDRWEFYKDGQWQKDFRKASHLLPDIPTEYSVTWDGKTKKFVCIYMEGGISGEIALRRSPHPWGPWSEPERIYSCPEKIWREGVFCYAAKAHPHLSAPGELVISYVANSSRFEDLFEDARLYWPRFVRVKL